MAAAKKRRHYSNHRGGRFWGLYVAFSTLLVLAAIAAGCIVFFKVSSVEIYVSDIHGNTAALSQDNRYSREEILEAAGIHAGDNLCLFNKNRAAVALLSRLPYISSVSIHKHLPGTLTLTLSESSAAAAIQTGENQWWLMDINGKLLEPVEEVKNCPRVRGLTLLDPEPGQPITVPDGSDPSLPNQSLQKDSLLQLIHPLQDYDLLRNVRAISLASESALSLNYAGRVRVKMLLESDFDYQVKYFSEILSGYIAENWAKNDTGTLDMTYADGHPHLTKNS